MKSNCYRACLVLVFVLHCSLQAAEVSDRFVPRQFKVWGTVVPSHAENIVMEGYQESDPPRVDLGPEYRSQEDDAQVGFRPFRHHYLGRMHPRFTPSPGALATPEMKAFATWGEYAPVALGVFAVKALDGLTARVSELADDQGHKIPTPCLDLRSVRFMPKLLSRNVYCLAPYILEKRPALTVPAGRSVFFWLTAYVQPGTPGGLYRGQVTLKSIGQPEQQVSVGLRVLPVALDETPRWFAILFGLGRSNSPAQGDPYHYRDEFINFREHGMNHLAYCQCMPNFRRGEDGKYHFDFDATPDFNAGNKRSQQGRPPIAELIKTAVEVGLDRAYFPHLHDVHRYSKDCICGLEWNTPDADQWYRELFKAWRDEAQRRKWPPIVFSISDEANEKKDGTLKTVVHLARLAKEGSPDLPTSAFTAGWHFGEDDLGAFGDALDYVIDGPSSKEYLEKVRRLGKKHMAYNHAPPDDPLRCRYTYGFLMETTGLLGHQQFRHVIQRKDGDFREDYHWYPKGGFPGYIEPHYSYVFPAADGLLPSPALEAMREGVTDSRYMETLKNLLAAAGRSGSADARKYAAAMGDEFRSLLAPFASFNSTGNNRGTQWLGETSPEAFDVARYRIARMIVKLRAVGGVEKPPADPVVREWTDSTGQHHISATLVDFAEGQVRLKKTDGTIPSIPLGRLSTADQEFLKTHLDVRVDVKR